MKIKSCITIAFREFVHSFRTFALYFIILVCLESISVTILKAATDTPDKIADIADELGYNCISVNCNEISDIESVFKKDDITINYIISDVFPSFKNGIFGAENNSEINLSNYSEGVIYPECKFENNSNIYLAENIISGNSDFESAKDYIWISDEISDQFRINTGDILQYEASDTYIINLEVAGIYTSSDEICSLFITEKTYQKVRNNLSYMDSEKFELWIKCNDFKKMGAYIDILESNKILYSYDDELYSGINMMYASFYAAVIILSAALTGIVIYLSDLYYNKRRDFFSINYIIGTSQKDIVNIFFILLGILLAFSLLVSGCICMLIVSYFDNYLFELFNIDFKLRGFPVKQFVIYCIILFFCLLIVLLRIKTVIRKTFLSSSGRDL